MPSLMPTGKQQFFDSPNGRPLAGGKLYTYAVGTTTPKATYSDAAGTIQNQNPIILDSRGEALIFWSGSYDVVLKDANDNLIYSVLNYATDAAAKVLTDLAASSGASLSGYKHYAVGSVAGNLERKGWEKVSLFDFMAPEDVTDSLQETPVNDHSYAMIALAAHLKDIGGGTGELPNKASFNVLQTIYLPSYARLVGQRNVGFYGGGATPRIIANFADRNAWVISADQSNTETGARIPYRHGISRADTDGGAYDLIHGIGLENILIDCQAGVGVYGGINMQGAPLFSLRNVGVKGADIWGLVCASWGYRIEQCWGETHLYGLIEGPDAIAGFADGYFNRYPASTKTITEANIPDVISSEYAALGLDANYRYRTTGCYSIFKTSGAFGKLILESWDTPLQSINSIAAGELIHIESAANVGVLVTAGVLKTGAYYAQCPTKPASIVGVNGRLLVDAFDGSVERFASSVSAFGASAKVGIYNADASSAKYDHNFSVDAYPRNVLYIDSFSGNDSAPGVHFSPIATLDEAIVRIAASSEVDWELNLKAAANQTFTNAGFILLKNKRIRVRSYSLDANGAPQYVSGQQTNIAFAKTINVISGLMLQDCDLQLDGVVFGPPGTASADLSYRCYIRVSGNCRINLMKDFYATVNSYGLVQPIYNTGSTLSLTLNEGTITGSGYIGLSNYASTGKCAVTFMNYGTVSGAAATNKFDTGGFSVVYSNL